MRDRSRKTTSHSRIQHELHRKILKTKQNRRWNLRVIEWFCSLTINFLETEAEVLTCSKPWRQIPSTYIYPQAWSCIYNLRAMGTETEGLRFSMISWCQGHTERVMAQETNVFFCVHRLLYVCKHIHLP